MQNVVEGDGWTNWDGPWDSELKMHAGGILNYYDGALLTRGIVAHYRCSTRWSAADGTELTFGFDYCHVYGSRYKAFAQTIRCILGSSL